MPAMIQDTHPPNIAIASGRRNLWLISVGEGVSTAGSSVTLVVLPLALRGQGAGAVLLIMLASMLPAMFSGPFVGYMIDKMPNKLLLVCSQGASAILLVAVAFVVPTLWPLLILQALASLTVATSGSTLPALIPHVVGEAKANAAYAFVSSGRQLGTLLGLGLGGVAVASLGARRSLLIDAASFAFMACASLLIRGDRRVTSQGDESGSPPSGGFKRLLAENKVIVMVISGSAVILACLTMVNVCEVFYLEDVLHTGSAAYGYASCAVPLGALGGAQLVRRLKSERSFALTIAAAGVGVGAALVLCGSIPSVAVNIAAWFVLGLGESGLSISLTSLIRTRTADEVRGRAFGLLGSAMTASTVIGMLVGGWLTAALGSAATIVAAGSCAIFSGLIFLWLMSRSQRSEPQSE